MSGIKSYLAEKYVYWFTRSTLKRLNDYSMNYPIDAGEIRNVLIVLPRDTEYLDAAISTIQKLRQFYSQWHYMVMDIDKVLPHKLNRLGLPNDEFIKELEKSQFQLVLDLNFETDDRIKYLITKLKIPYRLHLKTEPEEYYNIVVQPHQDPAKNFDFVLTYLHKIFVKAA